MNGDPSRAIAGIIGNEALAASVSESITSALESPCATLAGGETVMDVFNVSLKAARRDIDAHPIGRLFGRLVEHGPLDPDEEDVSPSPKNTVLSDAEFGRCIEFVHSVMVNRFKGDLAEHLALRPTLTLLANLIQRGELPSATELFWGTTVEERGYWKRKGNIQGYFGSFTAGADGLLVELKGSRSATSAVVHGVIEVKSKLRRARTLRQLSRHIQRLAGGLRLNGHEFSSVDVTVAPRVLRVMVRPSRWRLSREHSMSPGGRGTSCCAGSMLGFRR